MRCILMPSLSHQFHSNGQMSRMTVDGPRTDVSDTTEYHYDTLGRLTSIVNALGHTTTFQNFDAYGRPKTINFPAGLVRNLSYHPRGMVLTSTDGLTPDIADAFGQTHSEAPGVEISGKSSRRLDAGDDPQSAAALPAGLDVNVKDALEALRLRLRTCCRSVGGAGPY